MITLLRLQICGSTCSLYRKGYFWFYLLVCAMMLFSTLTLGGFLDLFLGIYDESLVLFPSVWNTAAIWFLYVGAA